MLAPDVLPKTAQDGFADRARWFPVASPHRFAKPLNAKGDADAIHGLRNPVSVGHHNVARPRGTVASPMKLEMSSSRPNGKPRLRVSFRRAIDADNNNLFVLPANSNDFILIVKQTQREVAIAVHVGERSRRSRG